MIKRILPSHELMVALLMTLLSSILTSGDVANAVTFLIANPDEMAHPAPMPFPASGSTLGGDATLGNPPMTDRVDAQRRREIEKEEMETDEFVGDLKTSTSLYVKYFLILSVRFTS